jgi:hypothetical protein
MLMPVKIFCCYAHEDEPLLKKLKTHLFPLQRAGLVDVWYDRDISAGTDWEQQIKERLNTAQIILLLVSPDFMASDYCYSIEMQRAIERHERGEARVIPIILRHTYWQGAPFGKLQALPTDAKPVRSWPNQDQAFFNVTQGIRKIVEEIMPKLSPSSPTFPIQRSILEPRQVAVKELKQQHGRWDVPESDPNQQPARSWSAQTPAPQQPSTSDLKQRPVLPIQPSIPEPNQAANNDHRLQSQRPLRVFLCHSSGDKPAVRELYKRLQDKGIAPWLDEEDLLPGQNWQLEIPKAVRNCDIVIICFSKNSINKAGYIQKEIKFALDAADEQPEGTIFIIPLKLEECDIPDRLNHLHWDNYFEERGFDKLMLTLQYRAQSLK